MSPMSTSALTYLWAHSTGPRESFTTLIQKNDDAVRLDASHERDIVNTQDASQHGQAPSDSVGVNRTEASPTMKIAALALSRALRSLGMRERARSFVKQIQPPLSASGIQSGSSVPCGITTSRSLGSSTAFRASGTTCRPK